MRYLEMIQREIPEVRQRIGKLEKELARHPEGFLQCFKNGNSYKWYQKLSLRGKGRHYITKENRVLAEQLALNTYHYCQLKDAKKELLYLQSFLDRNPLTSGSLSQHLLNHPEFKGLLLPSLNSLEKDLLDWKASSYRKNPYHPEKLRFETVTGEKVRSKSEAFIYNALEANNLAFRYDSSWTPDAATELFPDFIIRHPATGALIIWEHLGLLDKEHYRTDFYRRLDIYIRHGFIPGVNLILTGETSDMPFNPRIIDGIIEHYFF